MRVLHLALIVTLVLTLWACSDETGKQEPPPPEPPWPEWAFRHWIWEGESTQQSATTIVEEYLKRDIPVGAIIIDSPWATGYNTFDFDPALFPDPKQMIDDFHAKGVRVFLWVVPAINTDVTGLYKEAADKGFFMQKSADSGPDVFEWWKGEGSLIDYFNPEAVAWWHKLVDKALAYKIDGWKCDGLDFQSLLSPYSPGRKAKVERLEYSHTYYRDFFDYTRQKLGDDRIITARPVDNYGVPVGGVEVSFAPKEINWAGWVGDQDATFAGLTKALNCMYHSSALGYVAFGSDIGGYRSDDAHPQHGRSKELFIRWAQLGALCPIMENGGGGEHRPWKFDQQTTEIYRRFVKLHHALIPYMMEHGARAFDKGESLMTFLHPHTYLYLLGPDILVAPMLEPGTSITVDFPEGSDWVYLFDRSMVYKGGTEKTLSVPLDQFPIFIRAGSKIESTLELPEL